MTNEFKVTQADFRKYFIDLLAQKIMLKMIIIPPISFFVVLQFFEVPFMISKLLMYWIAFMGFLVFFFHIIPSLVIINRIKRIYKGSKYNCENTSLSFFEHGILLECGNLKEMINANSFSIIDNTRSSLLVLNEKNHLIILPKSKLDIDLSLGIIHILNQKKIENPFRKNIPPYFIVILCIIPILGGLAGLVTLLFGIFQYKNKILIISGAAGVIITIIYLTKMGNEADKVFNSPEQKKSTAEIRMEFIVRDIEEFKKQRGVYPKDLKILNLDEFNLTDPFMEDDEMKSNKEFVYEATETGYEIYSVGSDKKKGTSDDIFPSQKKLFTK